MQQIFDATSKLLIPYKVSNKTLKETIFNQIALSSRQPFCINAKIKLTALNYHDWNLDNRENYLIYNDEIKLSQMEEQCTIEKGFKDNCESDLTNATRSNVV